MKHNVTVQFEKPEYAQAFITCFEHSFALESMECNFEESIPDTPMFLCNVDHSADTIIIYEDK